MDEYLNFTEACKVLKITRPTLKRRMARDGIVPLLNGDNATEKLIQASDLPTLRQKRARRTAIVYPLDPRE